MVLQQTRHLHYILLGLALSTLVIISNASCRTLQAQTINPPPPSEVETPGFNPINPIPRPAPSPPPEIEPPPAPLPPPSDLLEPSPQTPQPGEELPATIPGTITVERFEFVGNTAFSAEELAVVTQPFTKRPLSFAQLLQARSAVTQLYVDNGYVTSGAYIPPQTIENGVVRIEIVEGSLEAINVEVKGRLHSNYVRDRLALATTQPLNVPRLLEALQLLQLNPLIEKISAELSTGTRPGTNVLDVTAETAGTFDLQVSLDNGRVPSVGTFERILQLSEANLTGNGDRLSGTYRNTDGSNDIEFAYTLPINPRNGTVTLDYRRVWSEVIEPPFNDIDNDGSEPDITSDYERYELTFRQPIIQTPNQELALGLSFDRQSSQGFFFDAPFPLTPGADIDGRTRVSSLRFFQEWTSRNEQEVFAARSEFSFGLDILGATEDVDASVNPDVADTSYFSWRGQAQWVRLLAPDTILLARTDMQFSDRPLVSLEQFAIGGLGSVEGYRQDLLLTDNGIFATVELRLPIFRVPEQQLVLQIIPFIDVGAGWNNSDVELVTNTLASVGLGLQFQQGDRFSARFDWGIPLVDVESSGNTLQENGFYFTVIYNPF